MVACVTTRGNDVAGASRCPRWGACRRRSGRERRRQCGVPGRTAIRRAGLHRRHDGAPAARRLRLDRPAAPRPCRADSPRPRLLPPGARRRDAVNAHQRPKIEQYGDVVFVVLRPVRYVDEEEDVQVGELHVFLGADSSWGSGTRRSLTWPTSAPASRRPDLLRLGPRAGVYSVLDRVVDDYQPVIRELRHDLDEIETQVFGAERASPSASTGSWTRPRTTPSRSRCTAGCATSPTTSRRSPRSPTADGFRQLLERLLAVNASLVGQRQNEDAPTVGIVRRRGWL